VSDALKAIAGNRLIVNDPASDITNRTKNMDQADKEKVCENFESFMIFVMLKNLEKMAQPGKKESPEQNYMSIAYEKVGDYIAKKGIGIKEMLMRYANRANTKVFK
jgi:Rod binding domain-containing protein